MPPGTPAPLAHVVATGALCALGGNPGQIYAGVRAGLGRVSDSSRMDRRFNPTRMALLPPDVLPELKPELDRQGWTSRQRRILALASLALGQTAAAAANITTTPVFLALPEPRSRPSHEALLPALRQQSEVAFDERASQVMPLGRAGVFSGLESAVALLQKQTVKQVLVGGVDTYWDLMLLDELESEGRLMVTGSMDGFIPGEGAAFLLLSSERPSSREPASSILLGVGTAQDPGHLYGKEPAKGEGLSKAMESMRTKIPVPPAKTVWASLNGESTWAKGWGVARLRHGDLVAPDADFEHPADCFGDLGAALGPMLLVLADRAFSSGSPGPALVWAASDFGTNGCAMMSSA